MAWQHTLKARWLALAPREQSGLTLAASALLLALVWFLLLAPALRTLGAAPAQHAKLDTEMERMQTLQTRAKLLQSKPLVSPQDGLGAVQAATTALGKGATLQVSGDLANVTLKQVSAQSLAPWFAPMSAAGLSPSEVHVQRSPGPPGEALWSGVVVFRLPAGAPR